MPTDLTQATLKESNSTESAPQYTLKIARKKLKLSAADIANTLNLTVTLIEKIEINDFTDIAPIFARGYVRSYAKLVKLPEENTSEIISNIHDADALANTMNTKAPRTTRFIREKKRWPKVVSCCVIIILAAIFISHWQSSSSPKNQAESTQTTETDFADISSLSSPISIDAEVAAEINDKTSQGNNQDQKEQGAAQ